MKSPAVPEPFSGVSQDGNPLREGENNRLRHVMRNVHCVAAVAAAKNHTFRKEERMAVRLIAGHGIQGDAHCGATVQHLYDKAKGPSRPNLRQVHLMEFELIEHLRTLGFEIGAGELGEILTTRT